MIKKTFLTLSLLALLASCTGIDPTTWNKKIVDHYNKSIDEIESFEEMISAEKVGDANAIKAILDKGASIQTQLDESINAITVQELPDDAEAYQESVLEVLKSMKDQVSIGLRFTNITEEIADSEIENYADKYDAASQVTSKKVETFIQQQLKFAQSNGIE